VDNNGFYGFHEDYKPRRKKGNGLAYFAVGLLGAIIGGFIMALIAPMYITYNVNVNMLLGRGLQYPSTLINPVSHTISPSYHYYMMP